MRVSDISYLLDVLQVPHPQSSDGHDPADFVMLGHSYGGGTSATAILRNIDGAMCLAAL